MREVSPEYMQSMFERETTIATVVLLTFEHEDFEETIRVTSDSVDTISRGETFIAYPFQLKLPSDEEDSEAKASITIDNVGRGLIAALRSISRTPPTMLIEIVKSTDWDTVEASVPGFILGNIKYDAMTITADLMFDSRFNETLPAGRFTPGFFPNVH